MSPLLVDILVLAIAISAGLTSGWWLQFWTNHKQNHVSHEEHQETREKDQNHTKNAMRQLQTLAADVAAQVGEHSERVLEINSELTSLDAHDADSVMDAVARLVEANARMHEQLSSAERRLEEQAREIESHLSEARTDALTQIRNRRAFDEEMQKCVDSFKQQERPSSVMMLDIDYFKTFNDAHGHNAGDEVLKSVANTLRSSVAGSAVVCRYGGEEFAIIFPGTTLSIARSAAERARSAVARTQIDFQGKILAVTVSAGLAEFLPGESTESVTKRSDDALYVSKRAGRNCGHYHDGANYVRFVARSDVESHPATAVALTPVPAGDTNSRPTANDECSQQPAPVNAKAPSAVAKESQGAQDPVTGLPTRAAFYDDVTRRIAEWKRGGNSLSIMLMQVYKLHSVGGAEGTRARQLVLRAATQFLRATMRNMDHIARYDDDTFSVLMPTASLSNAVKIAERLGRAVSRCKLPLEGGPLTFAVTFGVAEAVQSDGASELLQRTKTALDTGGDAGGSSIFVHDGEKCVGAEEFMANGGLVGQLADHTA